MNRTKSEERGTPTSPLEPEAPIAPRSPAKTVTASMRLERLAEARRRLQRELSELEDAAAAAAVALRLDEDPLTEMAARATCPPTMDLIRAAAALERELRAEEEASDVGAGFGQRNHNERAEAYRGVAAWLRQLVKEAGPGT